MISDRVRSFPVAIGRTVLPLASALICLAPAIAQDKPPESMGNPPNDEETLEIIELDDPTVPDESDELIPLSLDGSLLSVPGARRLMEDARTAVSAQDYDTAAKKLQDARRVLNQLSNYYQKLAATFSGIDNRIFESQRALALESAQLRDRATYELALLHRAQNQPELAIPLLIQIVSSQNPTRELGQGAYQQLFELGFANLPYPPNDSDGQSPLSDNSSAFSLTGARRLMDEARTAVSDQDYPTAAKKLQDARYVLNELSKSYQQLAAAFSGIDNPIFESQRALALESAQLRDRATYELALLHRAQNQPELAIPLLIEIVSSQNPTRELGQGAYQQLFELGFVDSAYPRSRDRQSTSSNP